MFKVKMLVVTRETINFQREMLKISLSKDEIFRSSETKILGAEGNSMYEKMVTAIYRTEI